MPLLVWSLSARAGAQDVAPIYYARVAAQRAAENALGRASSTAAGIVRNALDEPVAGATVTVIAIRSVDGQTKFDEVAKGVTDAAGRFAIAAAKRRAKGDLGLEVRAPGYMLWRRWAGGTVEGESITVNRVIGDAFFADYEHEADPVRHASLLLDLIGRRAFNSYDFDERIEQYYSHLGSVHDGLLAIARSQAFAAADDEHGQSPAQRARNLLMYWFDPGDEPLIRQWAGDDSSRSFHFDLGAAGASPGEALRAFADAHFAREPRTFSYFTDAAFSPDCTHAYVVFVVRYANWGYWQPVVLRAEHDRWTVALTGEGGRWHGLSPDGPSRPYPE